MNEAALKADVDVFLSYKSEDYGAVQEIEQGLKDKGLKTFMDRSDLRKGSRYRPAIEAALSSSKAGAVFCGPAGMGPWQNLEIDVMLDRAVRDNAYLLISVVLPGGKHPLGFLKQFLWIDMKGLSTREALDLLLKAIRREVQDRALQEHSDNTRAGISPYRPLLPFREEDAPFFCGRRKAIEQLKDKVQSKNFLAVVGASGIGKSSVVRAGLLPELRKDREINWEIATLVANEHPLKALSEVFVPLLEPTMGVRQRLVEIANYTSSLLEGKLHLGDMVKEVLKPLPEGSRMMLVVDQWEQIYSVSEADVKDRDRFIAELLEATAMGSLKVVLTLRGDFMGEVLGNRALSDRLQNAQINLSNLERSELEEAIVQPAEKLGLSFEPGLVNRILGDVGEDEQGSLPPLEFILDGLWRGRQDKLLTHATYEQLGGIKGALAKFGEDIYKGLDENGREAMRRLFITLVASRDGKFTRRRVTIPDGGRNVVQLLADKRLLVTSWSVELGAETVEICHEALIWHWQRLRDWLKAADEFLRWRGRLQDALDQYKNSGRKRGALLHEPLIKEAEVFRDSGAGDLTKEQLSFILRSRINRDLTVRAVIYGSLTAAAIATSLLIVAGKQWERAEELRGAAEAAHQLALSRQLESQADVEIQPGGNLQKAAVLALSSLHLSRSWEADQALRRALRLLPLPVGKPLFHSNDVMALSYGPDGWRLATASTNTVQLWDLRTGQLIGPSLIHESSVTTVSFSPDGRRLATACEDGSANLWAEPTHWKSKTLCGTGDVAQIAFDWESNLVATAGLDGTGRVYKMTGGPPIVSTGHMSPVKAVAFSPDGRWLATGCEDGKVILSESGTDRQIAFTNFTQEVWSIQFSQDSKFVVVGFTGPDGLCQLWHYREAKTFSVKFGDQLSGIALSADGKRLATAGGNSVVVWDTTSTQPIAKAQHPQMITAVLFHPSGDYIATASEDRTARVWNATNGLEMARMVQDSVVPAIAFRPDGEALAVASAEGTVRAWATTGYSDLWHVVVPNLVSEREFGAKLAFSPNGKLFATATKEGAKLWETGKGTVITNLPPLKNAKLVAFSPDGHYLAAADTDGLVAVSDAVSYTQIGPFSQPGNVVAVCFSGDGSSMAVGCLKDLEGTALVLKLPSGQELCQVKQTNLARLALNANGTMLATAGPSPRNLRAGSGDPKKEWVTLWSLPAHEMIRRLPHDKDVLFLAFSPDRRYVATASLDDNVRIWGVDDGTVIASLHQDKLPLAVCFSSGGDYLAVGCGDSARIWLWKDHREIARISHDKDVGSVAFVDKDNSLATVTFATGNESQIGRIWLWRSKQLIAEARRRITYNFPANELQEYLGLAR